MIQIKPINLTMAKVNYLNIQPYPAQGGGYAVVALFAYREPLSNENGEILDEDGNQTFDTNSPIVPVMNWPGDGSRIENIIGVKYEIPSETLASALGNPSVIEDYVIGKLGFERV